MPGKKGKKGKGKEKGKGKGDKKEPPPPAVVEEEPLSELSKEFYLIQIRDLEERVSRYQLKCDTLQSSSDSLQRKLTQQIEDQAHIITLLKKKIQEQSEQCAELDDQLIAVRHEKETEKERMMKEIASVREDAQERLDHLIAENTSLHATLDSLEEFKVNKERLEDDLKSKEEKIEQLKKEFDDKIYQLEKQAVLDKDRMRKEMVSKVNSVAAEFRKVSDLQMADTTKRTIQENVSIGRQLYRMSDKTMELVKENERLKEREKELCRRLEIMEVNERDMTRKSIGSQKVMEMMRDKIQEQMNELSNHVDCQDKLNEAEQKLKESQHTAFVSTQQAELLKSRVKVLEAGLKEMQDLYKGANNEMEKLQKLLTTAAHTLKSSMKSLSGPSLYEDKTLMSTLLEILLTAPSSRETSSSQLIQQAAYKTGDVGIVPVNNKLPLLQTQSTAKR